jgi:hypothetical protein
MIKQQNNDDNYEIMFEGKMYHSYEDYVKAKRRRTAGIFANSGMLAARLAIAEEMTYTHYTLPLSLHITFAIQPLRANWTITLLARKCFPQAGQPLDRCVPLTRSNLRRGKDRGAPSRGNSLLILSRAKRLVEASLQTMSAASQPLHDGEMIVRYEMRSWSLPFKV